MLSWRDLLYSIWRLFRLSFRIAFHRKLLFMSAGILAYYGVLYALIVFRPGEGFSAEQAQYILVEIPGAVLAIYLTMDLVAGERDKNTLEVLFSTSSTHYEIWTLRMISIYGVLAVTLMLMTTISYFFFAEFPFLLGGINAILPAFFVANLTFYFAVSYRSSNAAGMLSLGMLVLALMTAEPLRHTGYFLFLNPLDSPIETDVTIWEDRVLINRLGVFVLGCMLLFLALRRMERRERLLA